MDRWLGKLNQIRAGESSSKVGDAAGKGLNHDIWPDRQGRQDSNLQPPVLETVRFWLNWAL
jgi:hypothetical protein